VCHFYDNFANVVQLLYFSLLNSERFDGITTTYLKSVVTLYLVK